MQIPLTPRRLEIIHEMALKYRASKNPSEIAMSQALLDLLAETRSDKEMLVDALNTRQLIWSRDGSEKAKDNYETAGHTIDLLERQIGAMSIRNGHAR